MVRIPLCLVVCCVFSSAEPKNYFAHMDFANQKRMSSSQKLRKAGWWIAVGNQSGKGESGNRASPVNRAIGLFTNRADASIRHLNPIGQSTLLGRVTQSGNLMPIGCPMSMG